MNKVKRFSIVFLMLLVVIISIIKPINATSQTNVAEYDIAIQTYNDLTKAIDDFNKQLNDYKTFLESYPTNYQDSDYDNQVVSWKNEYDQYKQEILTSYNDLIKLDDTYKQQADAYYQTEQASSVEDILDLSTIDEFDLDSIFIASYQFIQESSTYVEAFIEYKQAMKVYEDAYQYMKENANIGYNESIKSNLYYAREKMQNFTKAFNNNQEYYDPFHAKLPYLSIIGFNDLDLMDIKGDGTNATMIAHIQMIIDAFTSTYLSTKAEFFPLIDKAIESSNEMIDATSVFNQAIDKFNSIVGSKIKSADNSAIDLIYAWEDIQDLIERCYNNNVQQLVKLQNRTNLNRFGDLLEAISNGGYLSLDISTVSTNIYDNVIPSVKTLSVNFAIDQVKAIPLAKPLDKTPQPETPREENPDIPKIEISNKAKLPTTGVDVSFMLASFSVLIISSLGLVVLKRKENINN